MIETFLDLFACLSFKKSTFDLLKIMELLESLISQDCSKTFYRYRYGLV